MTNAHVAFQVSQVLVIEGHGHFAVVGHHVHFTVDGRDAAIFLTPVLEKIEAIVNIMHALGV
jgi:hypothetical protein